MDFIGVGSRHLPIVGSTGRVFSRRLTVALLLLLAAIAAQAQTKPRLLIFSGQPADVYRHTGIDDALKVMPSLATKGGFAYDNATDPSVFTDENLAKYQAIFMNCICRHTRMLTTAHREAIQRFVRRGGGWAGSHCAAGMDLDWPWYQQLVGAVHLNHTPGSVPGVLRVDNRTHISMSHFTANSWNISKEELYYFRNVPTPSWRPNPSLPKVTVLLTFMEWGNGQTRPDGNRSDSSHMGGLAWYHEFEGGRSFYTGLGHEAWLYQDPLFRDHLIGGLKYVLKADGSTGLSGRTPGLRPNEMGPRAWIGTPGNPASLASRVSSQAYRVFDIQGNRLIEVEAGSRSPVAPLFQAVGMRNAMGAPRE